MIMPFRKNNPVRRRFGFKKDFYYSKKRFHNPFFQKKNNSISRTAKFLSYKHRLLFIFASVLVIILFWLIFFSSLFKINRIEISGLENSKAEEIELMAKKISTERLLGKDNLLLFNRKELARQINENYFLQELKIEKKYFHTLKILAREKQQSAVWLEDNQYYYLDNFGKIISQIDPLNLNQSAFPLIENQTAVKISDNQANIDQAKLTYATGLFNEFKNKKHGFDLDKFILDNDFNTIKMSVLNGPKIFFNTDDSIARQAAMLDSIIQTQLKDDFMKKNYINLRFGNKIYYQ